MTVGEVAALCRDGVHVSTGDCIPARLTAQVEAGAFSQDMSDRLFAGIPFHGEQFGSRSDKFWMVSHTGIVKDGGVEFFLRSWGSEPAYFWQNASELKVLFGRLGRPRVLEITMPLARSRHTFFGR